MWHAHPPIVNVLSQVADDLRRGLSPLLGSDSDCTAAPLARHMRLYCGSQQLGLLLELADLDLLQVHYLLFIISQIGEQIQVCASLTF